MKNVVVPGLVALVLPLMSCAASAAVESVPASGGQLVSAVSRPLYVVVSVPVLRSERYEQDVAESLGERLVGQMRRQRANTVVVVTDAKAVPAGVQVLELSLSTWRSGRDGDLECRFTAALRRDDAVNSLGIFQQSSLGLARRARGASAEDFERVADQACAKLVRALVEQSLI